MSATLNTIHVDSTWTLIQVRGDVESDVIDTIVKTARDEGTSAGRLAIDLAAATHVPASLADSLSGIEYVVVLTEDLTLIEAFRGRGVPVYESLDAATGDQAPLLVNPEDGPVGHGSPDLPMGGTPGPLQPRD